jgi:DNA-directed RNA polymerase subunit RPC12/RpoP
MGRSRGQPKDDQQAKKEIEALRRENRRLKKRQVVLETHLTEPEPAQEAKEEAPAPATKKEYKCDKCGGPAILMDLEIRKYIRCAPCHWSKRI